MENLSSNRGFSMPQSQAPLAFAFGECHRCRPGVPGRRDDLPLGAERRIGRVAPRVARREIVVGRAERPRRNDGTRNRTCHLRLATCVRGACHVSSRPISFVTHDDNSCGRCVSTATPDGHTDRGQ